MSLMFPIKATDGKRVKSTFLTSSSDDSIGYSGLGITVPTLKTDSDRGLLILSSQ